MVAAREQNRPTSVPTSDLSIVITSPSSRPQTVALVAALADASALLKKVSALDFSDVSPVTHEEDHGELIELFLAFYYRLQAQFSMSAAEEAIEAGKRTGKSLAKAHPARRAEM